MCASPFKFLQAGPPPPRVALLSDAVFFTRTVPVLEGASAAEVAAQVELALETLSPFPVAQLYHGHYWVPGRAQAFVFAAYRRRFTSEQTDEWPQALLVLPAFATLFGALVAPATTAVLSAPEGLTAVHWETPAMPTRVLFRSLAPEATDEERAKARDELLRAVGGSRAVIDLPHAPVAEATTDDNEIVFRSGTLSSRLPVTLTTALDVRDKIQLAELRRAKVRDFWLWRTALAAAVAILLLGVGELTMWGANRLWQRPRLAKLKAQAPLVEKIDNTQKLANRIDELTTKLLLPFEMMEVVRKKPEGIQWTRVSTSGLQTLIIEGKTSNAGDLILYKTTLRNLPECEKADTTREQLLANGVTTFTLTVTFKPGTIKRETPVS